MIVILLLIYLKLIQGIYNRGPTEHCYYEKFEPRCNDDEVILITNALYGRMKFGRCVKTNFGFIGCYDDVTELIQGRCSSRKECTVEVVEPSFPGLKPCNFELKSYLEVRYACIKELVLDSPDSCDLQLDLNVAALTVDSFVTSSELGRVTCGGSQSPLKIKVEAGQRINVSVLVLQTGDKPGGEQEIVNRKRSVFSGHDYATGYKDDEDDDGDDAGYSSSSYYDVHHRRDTFYDDVIDGEVSEVSSQMMKDSLASPSSPSSSFSSSPSSLQSTSVGTTISSSEFPPVSSSSSSSSSSSLSASSSSWRKEPTNRQFATIHFVPSSSGEVASPPPPPPPSPPGDPRRRIRRSPGLSSHVVSKRHDLVTDGCTLVGRIVEPHLPLITELCQGPTRKLQHVINSQSNCLEVYVEDRRQRFMLLFRVIGCPDIRVDQSTTRISYARDRATAEVTCLLRQQTWLITCRENRWVGFMEGNCSGAMEFFEEASKSPGVLRSFRLNSVLVVVIVTGVSGAISLFVLAVGLLIFRRFRSRVNHLSESELLKYPISLKDMAHPASSLDEIDPNDEKQHFSFLANGHAIQPQCVCHGNAKGRPESTMPNQEMGNKIFSFEIPTADLSEFQIWSDKLDTHADKTHPGRCHGNEGAALCIECLATERRSSPFDLS